MSQATSESSRTCYCGELSAEHVGKEVVLKGWMHSRRDHGGLIFVDLRDRAGMAQVVFDPDSLPDGQFEQAHRLRGEDVLAVVGQVRRRDEDKINPNIATGELELHVASFEVLSKADVVPFKIDEHQSVSEDHRLKYRYIDLRRPAMQSSIRTRARVNGAVRRYLDGLGFIEIETPILCKATPEGARDYLVPSRVQQGSFYALPQSPQLYKQILMMSGFDRYYQIARCFRDEDLRANRQPEFTQIDCELSFPTCEEIYEIFEGMMAAIYREAKGIELPTPFPRLTYSNSMARFGSDKPDLRFELEIRDVTEAFASGCEFKVFNTIIEKGGVARALCVPGGAEKYSNTQLKPGGELPAFAARYGAKGLAWFRAEADEGGVVSLTSNIAKFFSDECRAALAAALDAKPGDLVLIVCDKAATAATVLGQLRVYLGGELGLIDSDAFCPCWITDFPLFDWDEEGKRWHALHHPFTAPNPEDLDRLESDPGSVRSLAYDLSFNGEEVGGGSIRIHQPELQQRVFRLLGVSEDEAKDKFGFLLDALRFGAPPHGGIAFGVDRIMMQVMGTDSIRDVIAFPKTQSASCPMTEAPSGVETSQVRELGLRFTPSVEKKLADAADAEAGGGSVT